MLVKFTISNYLSFNEPVVFAMEASRERQHATRLFAPVEAGGRFLPVAALFGGNASGKSNFYRAIKFLRRLILRPPASLEESIPLEPYRLDEVEQNDLPSTFIIEILPADAIYRLTVVIARDGVREEKLEEIRGERSLPLYHRRQATGQSAIWDTEPLQKRCVSAEDRQFVAFKTRDTLPNQLFVAVLRGKKVPVIEEVTSWFADQLALMVPDSTLKLLEFNLPTNHGLLEFCNTALRAARTGIFELHPESVAWADLPISDELKEELSRKIGEGQGTFVRSPDGRRFSVARRNSDLHAARLLTHHRTPGGRLVRFELSNESEGTQRLLDLMPAFYELIGPGRPKVFIIDELDRSLHALLARHLLTSYLASLRPDSRRQLIFTTHDVTLLDQKLLRRDEIWFVERQDIGASRLFSLAGIEGVRYDKVIDQAYLQGVFGGIPRFTGPLFGPPSS